MRMHFLLAGLLIAEATAVAACGGAPGEWALLDDDGLEFRSNYPCTRDSECQQFCADLGLECHGTCELDTTTPTVLDDYHCQCPKEATCDDEILCTKDSCDPNAGTLGKCVNVPDDMLCVVPGAVCDPMMGCIEAGPTTSTETSGSSSSESGATSDSTAGESSSSSGSSAAGSSSTGSEGSGESNATFVTGGETTAVSSESSMGDASSAGSTSAGLGTTSGMPPTSSTGATGGSTEDSQTAGSSSSNSDADPSDSGTSTSDGIVSSSCSCRAQQSSSGWLGLLLLFVGRQRPRLSQR